MPENIVDRELEYAAREASPGRYGGQEIEAVITASSLSSSTSSGGGGSTSASAAMRRPRRMSRVSTHRDLERHMTEIDRMETAKSQHSATVGRSVKSRTSPLPLPAFGAGKPYPPPLPAKEVYVVEFDGPDDPLHAMNWPQRKK